MPANHIDYVREIETLSLLSATTGQLEIARLPVIDGPDWIIPKALILTVDNYAERIWTYLWHKQDVSVYHLFPKGQIPTHIVVLESFTDVHRLALQIVGEPSYHQIRIADLKDIEDDTDPQASASHSESQPMTTDTLSEASNFSAESPASQTADSRNLAPQSREHHFIFQPVMFQGERCVVPELDKLSHFLVDLDS